MDRSFFLKFYGKKIHARLAYPDADKKYSAILFIHGAKANLDSFDLLINVLKNKYVCLAFDHLGCGKSEGLFEDYSLESRLNQALFALNYLKKIKNVDSKKIIVIGASMGAHVASRLSEKETISTLILRVPACYKKDYERKKMIRGWLPWDRKRKYWPWRPSLALEAISKFRGRLLVVKSEKDDIIPDKIINSYLKMATKVKEKKLVIMHNAPHKIPDSPLHMRRFLKIIQSFLIKL